MKPSTGAAVRDRPESLSAFKWKACPPSPESAVMTTNLITATPETPLHEIATLLEKNSIKRVPIVENNQFVGIVSRANLIQALASTRNKSRFPISDTTIRDVLLARLKGEPWDNTSLLNVMVTGGVVAYGVSRNPMPKDGQSASQRNLLLASQLSSII